MRDPHAPREEFVDQLAAAVGSEARRRHRAIRPAYWVATPGRKVAALAAVIAVSMAVGGAAVAAAYQAQRNEQRDLLASVYERRAELAQQRLAMAKQQLQEAERRVALGIGDNLAMLEARVTVVEAEAQLKSIELMVAEVRLSGREPLSDVTSPLVAERDFVTERWQRNLEVPAAALEVERRKLQMAEQRASIGVGKALDVETARARILEFESAIDASRQKARIRKQYLAGLVNAAMADLMVLEAEAEQRRRTLQPKIELARKDRDRVTHRVEIGLAAPIDVAEVTLRLNELETDLAKADLDLMLIRKQIQQRKTEK
jgi:outer membrane protein TolC